MQGSCPGDGVIDTDAELDLHWHHVAHKSARTGQVGEMKLSNKLQSSSPLEKCRASVGASLPCKGAKVKAATRETSSHL